MWYTGHPYDHLPSLGPRFCIDFLALVHTGTWAPAQCLAHITFSVQLLKPQLCLFVILAYLPRSPVHRFTYKQITLCIQLCHHSTNIPLRLVCLFLEIRVGLCYLYSPLTLLPPVFLESEKKEWRFTNNCKKQPPASSKPNIHPLRLDSVDWKTC